MSARNPTCRFLLASAFSLLGLTLGALHAAAEGPARAFNEANAAYRAGEYAEAATRYEAVLAGGVRNGVVYYNLGNAYYKAGDIGRAVLSYERALKLIPGDGDARANLRFVDAVKVDRDPEEDSNVITRFILAVFASLSVSGVAIFCSVCVFAGAGAAIGWLLAPARKGMWIGLLVVAGAGLLAGGPVLAAKIHAEEAVGRAVILAEEVEGRSGPGRDFLLVFTLHAGTRVRVERAEGQWLLVQLATGMGGWVPAESLERI